jgi:polyhydroxybutyrate depolymerase
VEFAGSGSAPVTGSGGTSSTAGGRAATGPLPGSGGADPGVGGRSERGGGVTSGGVTSSGVTSGGATSGGVTSGGVTSGGVTSGGVTSGGAGPASGGVRAIDTCANKPGKIRESSAPEVTAAGIQRRFVYYAPPELDPAIAAPVVIVAHGWTMSGQQMVDLTDYQSLADREGFVVMFPDGQPLSVGPWNVGEGACPSNLGILPLAIGDDQAFIDAMLAFAEADRCIDRRHVFVTGFSMGGYFANETGCLRSDIAAIAPHSGGSHDLSACPGARKPVIVFHGTMDGLIPPACGKEARDRWVERNGCSLEVESVAVQGGHCEYSKGCPADGQVALCLFDGMDHGWAGGAGASGFPNFESASELGWNFFRRYAWN